MQNGGSEHCENILPQNRPKAMWLSDYFPFSEEQSGVANDSDSSPPRGRGRGRFEKGRNKAGSRGQSEDTRSTSSQGVDDESSSHVRNVLSNSPTSLSLNHLYRSHTLVIVNSLTYYTWKHPMESVFVDPVGLVMFVLLCTV